MCGRNGSIERERWNLHRSGGIGSRYRHTKREAKRQVCAPMGTRPSAEPGLAKIVTPSYHSWHHRVNPLVNQQLSNSSPRRRRCDKQPCKAMMITSMNQWLWNPQVPIKQAMFRQNRLNLNQHHLQHQNIESIKFKASNRHLGNNPNNINNITSSTT